MVTATAPTQVNMKKQGIFTAQRSIELSDDMQWYIDQVREFPLLSKAQEIELAQRIEQVKPGWEQLLCTRSLSQLEIAEAVHFIQSGEEARTLLIQSNLRLVISVARYYQREQVSLHDLIQEGNIGLMRATQTFDWQRGFKFSTYATYWIRQSITRAMPDLEHAIHLPCYAVDKKNNLKRYFTNFAMEHGYEPSLEELAEVSGEKPENIVIIWQHMHYVLSMDVPIEGHEDVSFGDLIEDPTATSEYDVEQDEMSERVSQAFRHLTKREQEVMKYRYGIGAQGCKMSLREIGVILGVTRERVRQIEEIAMRKLKKALIEGTK